MSQYALVNLVTQVIVGLNTADSAEDLPDIEGIEYRQISPEIAGFPDGPDSYHVWKWGTNGPYWHDPRSSELQASQARNIRHELLLKSDWRVTRSLETNVPMSEAWINYRQALRDISNQPSFPQSITWPAEPE